MIPDSALPVWTVRPDWKNGILERLEWLTDVIKSDYGTEQARALRLSPRRTFEVGFLLTDQERVLVDLWLHRMGSTEFMVPLWHDHAILDSTVGIGAAVLSCDTRYREFEVGGFALVVGADAFSCDRLPITAISDTQIVVGGGGVTRSYAAGTAIHPLRRARIADESAVPALTSRVGQGTLKFELNQANDLADEGVWAATYAGYPIILDEPNRREDLALNYQRNRITIDNEVGLREIGDDAGRAFTIQKHLTLLVGREEHHAFRQMIYRLRGQQGRVWIPTFNDDVELARDRLAYEALLDIKQIGYGYTGGAVGGRQHILIGNVGHKIVGTAAAPTSDEERLTLAAPLGADIAAGAFGSFMDTCRLASDAVEIQHVTDSDGVGEATLSFRSFRDERTTPEPIERPIPLADMNSDICGAEASSVCCWEFEYTPVIFSSYANSIVLRYEGVNGDIRSGYTSGFGGFGVIPGPGGKYRDCRFQNSASGVINTFISEAAHASPIADEKFYFYQDGSLGFGSPSPFSTTIVNDYGEVEPAIPVEQCGTLRIRRVRVTENSLRPDVPQRIFADSYPTILAADDWQEVPVQTVASGVRQAGIYYYRDVVVDKGVCPGEVVASNGLDGNGPFSMGFRFDFPASGAVAAPPDPGIIFPGGQPLLHLDWTWDFVATDNMGYGGHWRVSGEYGHTVVQQWPGDILPDVETFTATATLLSGSNPAGMVIDCAATYSPSGIVVVLSSTSHLRLRPSAYSLSMSGGFGPGWDSFAAAAPVALSGKPALNTSIPAGDAYWYTTLSGSGIWHGTGTTYQISSENTLMFNPDLYL